MDILNEVNKITTDLYLPATDEESTRKILENNKWGSILNKRTFKTLSDNDKSIKQILINIANEVNDFKTKKDNILLDIENAKTDIQKLESLININEQKTEITTGTDTSTYNIKGSENHLKYNGKDLARVDELPVLPDLSNYVKNDVPNTLTQKLTGTEIKANTIETTNLKVNGKNIETDFTNFAKLDKANTFTQKIKGTDIESNKLITNELSLNGVNVNLSDYSTNDNVVKQIEKVIGLTYGGNIQDSGNKTTGKFYFDSVNNYFYECTSNNNLIYVDNSKFRPISNKPINDKVNELSDFQQTRLYVHSEAIGQAQSQCNVVYKIGKLVTIIFDSGNSLYNVGFDNVIFSLPEGFRPKQTLSVPCSTYDSNSGLIYIQPDGIGKYKAGNVRNKNIIFTVTYAI